MAIAIGRVKISLSFIKASTAKHDYNKTEKKVRAALNIIRQDL